MLAVSGPSESFTIMLRPQDGIDLNEQIRIRYGNRMVRADFDGSVEHLLEDVRRRADRKRAFWFSASVP